MISLAAPQAVVMTSGGATIDDTGSIMIPLSFQYRYTNVWILCVIRRGSMIFRTFCFPDNIVFNKPAFQSFTHSDPQYSSEASNANDGNFLTDWATHATCSHTFSNTQAWWAADLLNHYTLQYVTLTNRLTHGEFTKTINYYKAKPESRLGYGCVMASLQTSWMKLHIHAIISAAI